MRGVAILLAASAASVPVVAPGLGTPKPGSLDARVLTAPYDANEVVPLVAVPGIVTAVEFAQDETVSSFVTGFSSAWEFAAEGNLLFLKPKEAQGDTNLVVVTDKRTYVFDLKTHWRASRATYRLRMTYPDEEKERNAREGERREVERRLAGNGGTTGRNASYTMNYGEAETSREIAPTAAWDDGIFTYLEFPGASDFPAAYRITEDGETLLNFHVERGRLVVHGVYKAMMLRAGKAVVGLYNEGWTGGGGVPSGSVTVPGLDRTTLGEGI